MQQHPNLNRGRRSYCRWCLRYNLQFFLVSFIVRASNRIWLHSSSKKVLSEPTRCEYQRTESLNQFIKPIIIIKIFFIRPPARVWTRARNLGLYSISRRLLLHKLSEKQLTPCQLAEFILAWLGPKVNNIVVQFDVTLLLNEFKMFASFLVGSIYMYLPAITRSFCLAQSTK